MSAVEVLTLTDHAGDTLTVEHDAAEPLGLLFRTCGGSVVVLARADVDRLRTWLMYHLPDHGADQ